MNCAKQLTYFLLLQIFIWNAHGQQTIDSLKAPVGDTNKAVQLSFQSFSALDPTHLVELDTQISLLPQLKSFGLALPNAYTIRLEYFDHAANTRFFQHGQNSMPGLKAFPENYVFVLPNQAYSEIQTNRWRALSNSQAGFQDNFDISLIFASAFRNNLTWNFTYDRQIYKGIYTHEKQRNTLFTTGLNYVSNSKAFQTNIVYTVEGHYLEHNWGISSDTFLQIAQFSVRESVPVNSSVAFTESSNNNLQSCSFIRLRKDATLPFSRLEFRSSLGRYESDYTDADNRSIDSLYFNYNIDSLISLHIKEDYWTNHMAIHIISKPRYELYGHLKHEWQSFSTGPTDRSRSVFRAGIKHKYDIDNQFYVRNDFNYSLTKSKSYPDVNVTGVYEIKKKLNAGLSLYHFQRPVPNLYESFYLNDSVLINTGNIHSDYSVSGCKLNINHLSVFNPFISIDFKRYNRYFYLGRTAQIAELNNAKVFNIQAGFETNPGIWNIKMQGRYSSMDPDSLGLTGWILESQTGIATPLFKNRVFTKLGVKCSLANYSGKPGYFPLLQWFHATGEESSNLYTLGVYAHFKVKDFQFKLDLDQIDSFWEKQRSGFIHRYPIYDFMLRMAISWRFLN